MVRLKGLILATPEVNVGLMGLRIFNNLKEKTEACWFVEKAFVKVSWESSKRHWREELKPRILMHFCSDSTKLGIINSEGSFMTRTPSRGIGSTL